MEILVDTQSITSQFNVTPQDIESLVDYVTKSVTASYAQRLARIAGEQLHSTRVTYQNAIKVIDAGRFKGTVLISYANPLVKMLEEGINPFDEKISFETSDKSKHKKDGGWYLTIPLAQGTPGAVGENTTFANIMPVEVYQQAKQLETNIPSASGMHSKGLAVGELPEQFQAPETRAAVTSILTNKTFEEYVHKTSIYAGIMKVQDNVTKQNSYMSFRRVSDKSAENSWIFSGLEKRDFAGQAMTELEQHMEEELSIATDNALKMLGL